MTFFSAHSLRPAVASLAAQSSGKVASMGRDLHALQSRLVHVRVETQRMRDLIAEAPVHAVSRLDWIHQQLQRD